MGIPADHLAYVRRGPYPIPPGCELAAGERDLLSRFGWWMQALADGSLAPITDEQRQFVRVAWGEIEAVSPFEHAWVKHLPHSRSEPSPPDARQTLELLAAARAGEAALRRELEERRAEVLAPVQSRLDELEREFEERLRIAGEEVARLQASSRQAVLALGESVKLADVQALYIRPRITWDTPSLNRYMEFHPEVAKFRKVGNPSVSLRFAKRDDAR